MTTAPEGPPPARRTVVVLVQNRPGALNRTVALLRARDVRVASLAIGDSERPGVKRMTVVVEADAAEHVVKQLNRLIEVLEVKDVTHAAIVERETALVRIHAPPSRRDEVRAIAERFGARVSDGCPETVIVEITVAPARLSAFLETVRPFGVREMMRSGRLAITLATDGGDIAVDTRADAPPPWWVQADGII